jgi:hypothetical protein
LTTCIVMGLCGFCEFQNFNIAFQIVHFVCSWPSSPQPHSHGKLVVR